jgi:hypothetical protein
MQSTASFDARLDAMDTVSLDLTAGGGTLIGSDYNVHEGRVRINTDSRDGWTYEGPIVVSADRLEMAISLTGHDMGGLLPKVITCTLALKARRL